VKGRFIAFPVSGHRGRYRGERSQAYWYVLDRVYNHRVVASFYRPSKVRIGPCEIRVPPNLLARWEARRLNRLWGEATR
jgi:hypothetical protein